MLRKHEHKDDIPYISCIIECMFGKKKYIYLDHAATTPMDANIAKRMSAINTETYANAGALHSMAQKAKGLLNDARARVAGQLGAQPTDIIFTRGGTESNVMALWGVIAAYRDENPDTVPHIIISTIEHAAVRESAWAWAEQGIITVDEVPVNMDGVVDIDTLKSLIQPETILVSVMYANNEIGSIQPIRDIAKIIRTWRKHNDTQYPYFHTDAVQAVNYLDMNIPRLGVDLLSITASKMYGPKGIGVLYIHPRITVTPLMYGGSQEFDMRPGTPDVAGCVACADAFDMARSMADDESARLDMLKTQTIELLDQSGIEYRIHGDPSQTIACTLNIGIPSASGERLVIELDAQGFAVSSRAACSTNADGESHILTAMGYTDGWGSIRISMGRSTSLKDMKNFVKTLVVVVEKLSLEQELMNGRSMS